MNPDFPDSESIMLTTSQLALLFVLRIFVSMHFINTIIMSLRILFVNAVRISETRARMPFYFTATSPNAFIKTIFFILVCMILIMMATLRKRN